MNYIRKDYPTEIDKKKKKNGQICVAYQSNTTTANVSVALLRISVPEEATCFVLRVNDCLSW